MSTTQSPASPRQTWDQKRAAAAWRCITDLAGKSAGQRQYGPAAKDYARAAKQTSTRILTGGLGQALAFLLAKAAGEERSPLRQLYNDLSDWVLNGRGIRASGDHLLDGILHGDAAFLRRATDETLAYLGWLTRFAEAEGLYKDEKISGGSDEGR